MATDTVKAQSDPNVPEDSPKTFLEEGQLRLGSSEPASMQQPLSEGDKDNSPAPDSEPVTDAQKKVRRAERFGMPVRFTEDEKRNSRAERFGTGPSVHGLELVKNADDEKRKARAERFGISQTSMVGEEAKKKARLDRFVPASKVDVVEEDKRKARAIRFSEDSTSLSNANTKENLEHEEAVIAGKRPLITSSP